MKRILSFAIIFATVSPFAFSQSNIAERSSISAEMAPFYHGVASGDPLTDRVIIWTRVTPDQTPGPFDVDWEVATDTAFSSVVQSGTFTTDDTRDYTVKVDVTGLEANTWYYYRFELDGVYSLTGRTRTTPIGLVDSLRFAVISCSDYVDGYFHGYRKIAERDDIDAVIHLGDYIYENGSEGSIGRPHDPPERINELDDYRQRYSQYRLDPDLRCAHQLYPFINVWDDHEIANNGWMHGAEAHDTVADGDFDVRKYQAVQAFYEWIPIRHPNPDDTLRIYRTIKWGDLMDLFMIDTRTIGRDVQDLPNTDDPNRNMIGPAQLGWLSQEMQNSTAKWKVIGQQVMMAPLEIPLLGAVNPDQWDGYRAERNRFYDTVLTKNIENVVVLTGDIHTAWANNLKKGNDKIGVEFVCSSITTMNSPLPVGISIIQAANPHIQYANLSDHGYTILDINQQRTQADFYYIGDIEDPNDNSETAGAFWYVNDTERSLQESNAASVPRASLPALAPVTACQKDDTGIPAEEDAPEIAIIGTYPNPFWESFVMKTYLFRSEKLSVDIFDGKGALIQSQSFGKMNTGLHYIKIDGQRLPAGNYIVNVNTGKQSFTRKVVKL